MHKDMPTARDPRPAARVGYHMGMGLATTLTRRIAATLGGHAKGCAEREKPAGGGPAGFPMVRT